MFLCELVDASRRIAATRSRSEKIARLAEVLRRLEPAEIGIGVAFLSGQTRQGRTGLGWATMDAARRSATAPAGTGAAGADARGRIRLGDVDRAFEVIAGLSGPGSSTERKRALAELFGQAGDDEADFLVRLITGEMRQGALEGIMEEGVARAAGIPVEEVRRAAMLAGRIIDVAETALTEGRPGLGKFHLRLFTPVRPMLAQTAAEVGDALERLGEASFEYKLDGARVQVHKSGPEVRVFSRQLNDVTPAVPELLEIVRGLPVRDLILDGEAIALRPDGRPQTFQVTMRRFGRKLDVDRLRGELPLTPFFFDVLRIDDQDLLGAPARERFALLEMTGGRTVPRRRTRDPAEAEAFLDEALERGHEGVMAKSLEAAYEAGSRGFGWLKIKPAHTLDLVVLAAERGHGRRSAWLSNIHLGALDPSTGGFVMVGKTFKGMTDTMLAWQTRRFQELAVATDGFTVHVRPELVVEVAFGDVQQSPRYPGGVALRFARVKRYREDKNPAGADTVETIRALLEGVVPKRRDG
jgi:DNA ligase-1